MPWQLEIHHLDVQATGDATLIIVRETGVAHGTAPVVRSALIDGGRATKAVELNNYIGHQLDEARLDVIVVTHYQDDHMGGITRLLNLADDRFSTVRIYDQGWPGAAAALEPNYIAYIRAINGLGPNGRVIEDFDNYCADRTRVTYQVQADGTAQAPAPPTTSYSTRIGPPAANGAVGAVPTVDQAADWLLTAGPADILWAGFPGTLGVGGYAAGVAPAGAPTMRIIAANKYVRGVADPIDAPGLDVANQKSLGVEVTFGNFHYYVAGDIDTPHENQIEQFLNGADDVPGRVVAVKASHHGSNTATSRGFIDRVRPAAAFISCGTANIHSHPALETINTLDGFPANAVLHAPGIPTNRPVYHYLTGYQQRNPPVSRAGTAGFTAGDPLAQRRGDIVVTVTAAQSGRDQRGGIYLGVEAAAIAASTNPAVGNALDQATAALAAAGAAAAAVSFGAAAAAKEFLTIAGPDSIDAGTDTATAVNDAIGTNSNGVATAIAVTAAAMVAGAPAGPAAGAGAVAGTYVGGCGAAAITAAVTAALTGAFVPVLAAQAAGAAAAGQAANAGGLFTVRYFSRATGANQTHTHI